MEVIYYPNGTDGDYRREGDPTSGYIKNSTKLHNGRRVRGCNTTLEEVEGILPYTFCFDVGAASQCGLDMYDFIIGLGDKLGMVLLRDTDVSQHSDSSLLPFSNACYERSVIPWGEIIRALQKINFKGTIVIDYYDSYLAVPIPLRSAVCEYAYKIGEYFKWQFTIADTVKKYDKRILFGAGNMCRNYMNLYGNEYPPMYIVDNNKNAWGTKKYDVEVISPDKLPEVDESIPIFICSIYYAEMENQLKRLGVRNPIEYFNDEFLPY